MEMKLNETSIKNLGAVHDASLEIKTIYSIRRSE
jgi:hypothetical protein